MQLVGGVAHTVGRTLTAARHSRDTTASHSIPKPFALVRPTHSVATLLSGYSVLLSTTQQLLYSVAHSIDGKQSTHEGALQVGEQVLQLCCFSCCDVSHM